MWFHQFTNNIERKVNQQFYEMRPLKLFAVSNTENTIVKYTIEIKNSPKQEGASRQAHSFLLASVVCAPEKQLRQ